jgi:hypothetical protein
MVRPWSVRKRCTVRLTQVHNPIVTNSPFGQATRGDVYRNPALQVLLTHVLRQVDGARKLDEPRAAVSAASLPDRILNQTDDAMKTLPLSPVVPIALGIFLLFYVGCDTSEVTGLPDPEVADIVIHPPVAELAPGEHLDFSAFIITTEGDSIGAAEAGFAWSWWSTDTNVFTVDETGTAVAHQSGEAFCIVELDLPAGGAVASLAPQLRFTGRDSARLMVF